ncbi:MAG TPA: hypothetical protein VJH22_04420 [Candidatus Nanoarchaeia archaeon]|nr:hypothetical protein [Candidatus Nanoarchaeia archaeon]
MVLRPRVQVILTNMGISTMGSALLDSGADRTVIPLDVAEALGLSKGARWRLRASGDL